MIVMERAFQAKTKIMEARDLTALKSLLPLNPDDLLLTEERLLEILTPPPFVKCLPRERLGQGPNTPQLIEAAVHEAGAGYRRVIGIGGGATLDLAKLLTLEQALPVADLFSSPDKLIKARSMVLVPTTPGTGSEVTPYCAVYFPEVGAQLILKSSSFCADATFLCPELLDGIPFNVLAASSFDAFTHACESYLSALSSPFSRLLSLQAIRMLLCAWQDITHMGSGALADAISQMQTAGTMAGIAYANAGAAAVHAISYPLSTRLKIKHGEANYLVFKAVMDLYRHKAPHGALSGLQELIATVLGGEPDMAFETLDQLCQNLLPRRRLSVYGMQEGQIIEFTDMVLTRQNMLIANGYTQLSAGDIANIYRSLL